MALPVIGLIGTAIATVGKVAELWMKKKVVRAEGKVALEQKRAAGDIEYDIEVAKGMKWSWKDEWFALLLSAPFIACFIPPLQPHVKAGFEILKDSTPVWYQYAFIGAIIASFGLKDWFKSLWNK